MTRMQTKRQLTKEEVQTEEGVLQEIQELLANITNLSLEVDDASAAWDEASGETTGVESDRINQKNWEL